MEKSLKYHVGQGQVDNEWSLTKLSTPPSSPDSASFAPRGLPQAYSKFRRKLPGVLQLDVPRNHSALSRFHNTCSSALNSRLGRTENAQFLERFRYTIIASQLLNDHANAVAYNPPNASPRQVPESMLSDNEKEVNFTSMGLSITAGAAFALVWSIHWVQHVAQVRSGGWGSCLALSILTIAATVLYTFFRRRRLHYLRNQAIETVSSVVFTAQAFDALSSAAVTIIQEVELVSRGYRISSPLPPVSRFEEQSHSRRCTRLRRTLRLSLKTLLAPLVEAYACLRPLAVELDLEKYHDIYEITRSDVEEIGEISIATGPDTDDLENLKSLKLTLQKVYLARKMFLCTLLALDADGGKSDFPRWTLATQTMQSLSSVTASAASSLDAIFSEEERSTLPPTPKFPSTPGRERMRTQIRKLGSLSHGIRGLQAKMHILREESDRTLDASDADITELGSNLMVQYDSIGADLRALMQDWEDGRTVLATNIDRNERRISLSSAGILSRSPTPNSLGGLTAVSESGPTDALKILDGELRGTSETTSSDEEVFEAIALPRQRSTLTRDERIAKMKEDRMRQAIAREKSDASTHMLKELETVIKLRPRGRTTGRMTTV